MIIIYIYELVLLIDSDVIGRTLLLCIPPRSIIEHMECICARTVLMFKVLAIERPYSIAIDCGDEDNVIVYRSITTSKVIRTILKGYASLSSIVTISTCCPCDCFSCISSDGKGVAAYLACYRVSLISSIVILERVSAIHDHILLS